MDDRLLHPERQSALIESVYAAALEPQAWQSFIQALGDSCRSAVAFYMLPAEQSVQAQVGLHYGHDESYLLGYERYSVEGNLLALQLQRNPSEVVICRDLCAREELLRCPFYASWMRPQGFGSTASLRLTEDPASLFSLSLLRRSMTDLFDVEHREALKRLSPHLRRAVAIARQMQRLQAQQRWQTELIGQLQLPLFVLDAQARIESLNPGAEALLGCGRGLLSSRRCLRLADAEDQRRFDVALAQAAGTAGTRQAGGFVLRGGSLGPRLRLTLCPLPDAQQPFGQLGAQVLLLVHDPAAAPPLNETAVREAFDLSGAEARLALQLCAGLSVEQAAAANGVRVSTVRSQLHSLLLKTGTQRQADLVRLLLAAVGLRLG